jgi:hypothetical protein
MQGHETYAFTRRAQIMEINGILYELTWQHDGMGLHGFWEESA